MSTPKVTKISIAFTKDEVDWLSWVLTDVLGKATHVPTHEVVAKKVSDALMLINEVNAAVKEAADDVTAGTHAGCNADA